MQNLPVISCLCRYNRQPELLKQAIECFHAQTYPNKELILMGRGEDEDAKAIVKEWEKQSVTFFDTTGIPPKEQARAAIQSAGGDYFAVWDAGDFHHSHRLEIQMREIKSTGKQAAILAYWLLYDRANDRSYLSFPSMLSRSIVCKKSVLNNDVRYTGLTTDEDTDFLMQLNYRNVLCPVIMPQLYINIYHGWNSEGYAHFEGLFTKSQRLSNQSSGIIKKSICGGYDKKFISELLSGTQLTSEFDFFRYARMNNDEDFELKKTCLQRLTDKTVRNGPFKGLQYPTLEAAGSAVIPKLVGSYEQELAPLIYEIMNTPYRDILNIGSAEGYYANGLALKCPQAVVHAYDTDKVARDLCEKMAALNGVSHRVHINSTCTDSTLREFTFSGKSLILCDCEGYEYYLFNENNVPNLHSCDLLIETHDFININITSRLEKLFRTTHTLSIVQSVDDLQKARTYTFSPFLDITDLNEKKYVYKEGRPCVMEWFWLKAKHQPERERISV